MKKEKKGKAKKQKEEVPENKGKCGKCKQSRRKQHALLSRNTEGNLYDSKSIHMLAGNQIHVCTNSLNPALLPPC